MGTSDVSGSLKAINKSFAANLGKFRMRAEKEQKSEQNEWPTNSLRGGGLTAPFSFAGLSCPARSLQGIAKPPLLLLLPLQLLPEFV